MLPVFAVKVVQIAAGYVVGSLASDTLNGTVKGIKKVVKNKKEKAPSK